MALSVPRFLSTKTYTAQDDRHMLAATGMQPGVMALGATTEFKVTQDTGSNMNVKIAAGDSGAWVSGLDTTRQGAYHVFNDAIITTAVSAANATNPRIDQVVLRVYDSTVIGGGTDAATIEVIAGTATSGATLDNRTGAANLTTIAAPKSLLRLADILVPAASTAVTNANVRDRRPWARGAYRRIVRNANAAAGNDYTINSPTFAAIDATNMGPRIECTGNPIRMTIRGRFANNAAGSAIAFQPRMDAATVDGATSADSVLQAIISTANGDITPGITYDFLPSAGSHLFTWYWSATGSSLATLFARATIPVVFTIEEIVRQNTDNT